MHSSDPQSIPTRYTLLSRLNDWDDQESWKDFFDTYWQLIYATAMKSGLTEAEAQDVVQETVICVAKDIHKFERDRRKGSFKGWLHQIIRWRVADQMRKRKPASQGRSELTFEEFCQLAEQVPDETVPAREQFWEDQWRQNLFEAAVARVKRRVKEEHYQIFDLYVMKQWPAKKIKSVLRVSLAQIYVAKHRVGALIKKEVKALEQKYS
ncbi:MAG TPA: sigma-70 family RNA polymerase sigma factor [Clostridia bacterium]|nr:sigma-70 family RNA polymerase sigma factor [Clostridia bacterium]